jgi:autotransporter-associated beta strand protein
MTPKRPILVLLCGLMCFAFGCSDSNDGNSGADTATTSDTITTDTSTDTGTHTNLDTETMSGTETATAPDTETATIADTGTNTAPDTETETETETNTVIKPSVPVGLGHELNVVVPSVADPLPAAEYVSRNNDSGRFYRDTNPINFVLKGINTIWQGTTDNWQTTAGDYTDYDTEGNGDGYVAGDGPGPADYVTAGTEIKDADTWAANIQYVIDVTENRTDEEEYFAFLDDIRSKNYSVIDGFGPLTEEYAKNSGAYAEFETVLATDVTDNNRYLPDNNDDYVTYGGQSDSTLGDMVALAQLFRDSSASTSGPKYLFGTPRPWRMTDTGTLDFLEVETLTDVIDGSTPDRATKEVRIDRYTTSVQIIPGLYCGRRAHSSGKESADYHDDGVTVKTDPLYSPTTENRRKDNGYPSGHTNAGYLASLAYAYMMPERFAEHMMRASDIGENRIIAGMHSPIDIIGGRIQAMMVATYALHNTPDVAEASYQQAGDYFGTKAAAAGMTLYDYAHQTATEGSFVNADHTLNVNVFNTNRYANHDAIKETFTFRITYGLPQNGTAGEAPIVPEGAELLLKTRQPYLTDAQRRAVLYTTSVDSGYPILDATNGWGRLNLLTASDGYGAFLGDVTVNMDASRGRFNARDWWRNDIGGIGLLTKEGSGMLTLTGNNSYEGGTVIKAGTLEAASATAFGTGDVYMQGGAIVVDAAGSLALSSDFTMNSGTLSLVMDSDSSQMTVADLLYIEGGDLTLDFSDYPIAGTTDITLITAGSIHGKFSSVTAEGYTVSLTYSNNHIIAQVTPR